MPEIKHKPHYFELSMRSVSTNAAGDLVLNQEVPLVREYAETPGELTLKQMMFTKSDQIPVIIKAVIKIMDGMSMPYQEIGMAELAAQMADMAKVPPGQAKKK
jgi:hypothetical protein